MRATAKWLLVAASSSLVGILVGQQALPAGAPQHYNSGNASERLTTVPVLLNQSGKRTMFCIDLGTVPAAGEIISADAEMEVTNNLGYNVSFVQHVVLGDSCAATSGTEITEANGANITPGEHHGVASRSGALTVSAGNTRRFVVVVVWAASTAARPGHTLKVESDYGRLSVLRWRN